MWASMQANVCSQAVFSSHLLSVHLPQNPALLPPPYSFVDLLSPLDTNRYLPFLSYPLISTMPSTPMPATVIKLVHIPSAPPGPLLAHKAPQSVSHCVQTPASPTLLPLNIPCLFLPAPCPFTGVHAAFPPRQQSESGTEVMDGFQNGLVSPGSFEA